MGSRENQVSGGRKKQYGYRKPGKNRVRFAMGVLLLMGAVLLTLCCVGKPGQGETEATGAMRQADANESWTEREKIVQADMRIKKVALTYDDGPDPVYSRQLLDILRQENVTAAFFLLGEKIQGQEEIVKQMYADGHIIGNHTYSHVDLKTLSMQDAMAQLADTNEAIQGCIGESPEFFRPPFGNIRKEMDQRIPMVLVSWNIDPKDWECQDTGMIIDRVMKDVKENGIILMHDGYESTVEATRQIIPLLREKGYTIVPVEELLYP